MQIADIRYTSKADFAGSALHILHRGTNSIVYLATAQETGLKLLLKVYDIGGHLEDLFLVCDGTLLHYGWMTQLVLFCVAVHVCFTGRRRTLSLVCGRTLLHHGWQATSIHSS